MAVVVGTAQGKLTLDASKFITNIDSSYKALKKFNDLISDTQKALNNLPEKTLKLNTEGLTDGLKIPSLDIDPDGNIPTATTNLQKMGKYLSGGMTVALEGVGKLAEATFSMFLDYSKKIVAFAKDSLNTGMQFDATMSQVEAISGATGEEFDALREKAIEMGAQTKFSASEAGQAMVYMGMAGWKTDQILDGLNGVMSLAAASGEDLATTSDIVTDALTAFGLQAEDASHFADVLAAASVNSNTNVALMGETFKYVAPVAGTLKYSIEDTAVAIGLMANSGIKGSQAGTALRNVITNLEKPSKTVAAAMSELGISLVDQEGNTKSLMELMQNLRQSFSGLSGDKAFKEYQTWVELIDEELKSGKISQEEYEEELNKFATMFLASTETLQGKYAAMISGKYGLSGLLAIVNSSEEDFDALTQAIYGASDGMGSAAEMEKKMMNNLQGSTTIFKSTLETFKISVSDILKGTANEFVNFGQKSVSSMTEALQKDGIPGLIREVGRILPELINKIVEYIPVILPSLIEGFKALINGLINAIPDALPKIIDGGIELIMGLATGISQASSKLLPMIPEIIGKLCDSIDGNSDEFIKAGFDLLLNVMEGIAKALPEIIKTVVKLVRTFISNLKDYLPKIIEAGIDIILALIEGLTDPETIEAFIEIIGDIVSIIIDTLGKIDWLETADKIFSGIGKALQGIFEGALGAIDKIFGTNLKGWAQEVGKFMDYLKSQSFEFGKSLANAMNKTEIELNELHGKYSETYKSMLDYYAQMVKAGTNSQEAMAAAYQKYFQSAEAQYVFRERFASQLVGTSTLAENLGTSGMTNQQLVDLLSNTALTTGNTYNFYSNEPIDEKKAADEIRQVNEEILMGS